MDNLPTESGLNYFLGHPENKFGGLLSLMSSPSMI